MMCTLNHESNVNRSGIWAYKESNGWDPNHLQQGQSLSNLNRIFIYTWTNVKIIKNGNCSKLG